MIAPGVLGLIANRLPGAVDRQQRVQLRDLARQRDTGKDLGEECRRGPVHHRVRCGDYEARAISDGLRGSLEGQAAGGGHVPDVHVPP